MEIKREPMRVQFVCPNCEYVNKPIPAHMGDKIIKCAGCGKYIKYGFRKNTFDIVARPERTNSSGLVLY